MKAIEILKNFVEEKLSTEELEMALYSNQELISLLENTKAKPYMNSNSTYEYLISQDLTSLDRVDWVTMMPLAFGGYS